MLNSTHDVSKENHIKIVSTKLLTEPLRLVHTRNE